MRIHKIVDTPIAMLAAVFAVFLILACSANAASPILDPASPGFGGESRSADYDTLLDALYSSGNTTTTIPTANGDALWVPWFSTSSQCTADVLQKGAACNAGTIDFEHNCMVSDELSQVGVLISMGNNQSRMDEYYNTLLATRSTNGHIPSWRVYRNGSTIESCMQGINGNCDTASDATARMIIALYTASANARFTDEAGKQQYRQLADTLAADFADYEVVYSCKPSSLGYGDICYWLAAGSGAKRGGMETADFSYTGYYPDAITAMLQACSQTGDRQYCAIAGNLTLNYLEAAKFDGTSFSVPPGRSFRWIDVNGTPTAQCTNTCNPVQWDGMDAPRAIAICETNYYAGMIGYDLPGLQQYCSLWNSKYMLDPGNVPVQYAPDGTSMRSDSSYFAQGLQALFQTGTDSTLFEPALDSALKHYSTSTQTFDWTACFGVYTQAFPVQALGVGLGRNLDAFPPLKPLCTPTTEVCDGVDNDCDGIADEGGVCTPWYLDKDNDSYGDARNSITSATQPAGYSSNRLDCDDSNSSVNPSATETCNRIDDDCDGQVDEGNVCAVWYRDADNDSYGNVSLTYIGTIAPAGYVSNKLDCNDASSAYSPAASEACDLKDNNCNGQIDENNVCANYTCYSSVQKAPVSCTGGSVTSDSWNGCRVVVCTGAAGYTKVLGCDKTGYFEVYRQGSSGTPPKVCLGTACISDNGYAKSGSLPVCSLNVIAPANSANSTNTTNTAATAIGVKLTAVQSGTMGYTFTCAASGFIPADYIWQFGDGASMNGTSSNTTHKYAANGNYLAQCFARKSPLQASNSTMVNVSTVSSQTTTTCYNAVKDIPAKCSGGTIVKDSVSGVCRTVVCTNGTASMQAQACDKSGYFELYKQSQAGTLVKSICIGSTCVSSNGYAKSSSYPICS